MLSAIGSGKHECMTELKKKYMKENKKVEEMTID